MSDFKISALILIVILICGSVEFSGQERIDRRPYAAGRFYENDSIALISHLEELFNSTSKVTDGNVQALISPHAGFSYSGEVAAMAYRQLKPNNLYDNIFVIGSSHTTAINGASIYSEGDYITPLGKVIVNTQLANELIETNKYFSFIPGAHQKEHILENQLPFLQYYFEKECRIIPISIGTTDDQALRSIAKSLKPFFNENNLFVISADFSHYPNYEDACQIDSITAKTIMLNDENHFKQTMEINTKQGVHGLKTCTCGGSAIRTLLYLSQYDEELSFVPLKYMNSGDAEIGDKNRVVGYFALALVENLEVESKEYLSKKDKQDLLNIARLTIEEYINKGVITDLKPEQFSETIQENSGAFVTLNKNKSLRGCIGRFNADQPLYLTVQQIAISAATQDYRFQVVRPSELGLIEIEISVLTPLQKINSIEEIELGRDGIYIVKGDKSGTFLPQVATDTGWSLEEFLGHCSRDKAGLGWNGWKDADIYVYQAIVFGEGDLKR